MFFFLPFQAYAGKAVPIFKLAAHAGDRVLAQCEKLLDPKIFDQEFYDKFFGMDTNMRKRVIWRRHRAPIKRAMTAPTANPGVTQQILCHVLAEAFRHVRQTPPALVHSRIRSTHLCAS